MPTYAYACTECPHRFDAQQSFSDAALTQCPECTGRLRKVFGAVGVVFKGSGFYRTDSRDSGGKQKTAGSGSTTGTTGTTSPSDDSSGTSTSSSTSASSVASGSSTATSSTPAPANAS